MNNRVPFGISVVIPLYNKEPFIRRTLESVLAQTLPADEIIIVNDSSTDDSVARVRELASPAVRLIEQSNAGPGPARNRGVAEATQPWIAFLDADDLWRPNHLETLARLSARFPDADAVATSFERCRASENMTLAPADSDRLDGALIDYFAIASGEDGIWTSCVAIKRSATTAVGEFGDFWPGEDREYWARLALDHAIALSGRRTALYVQQTGGLMDSIECQPYAGFVLNPVFATLDRALADPRHAAKHPAIRQYRASLLRQNVRQALYRGEVEAARQYIAELEKSGPARLGLLRALSWLPASVVRAGISARARFRHLIGGTDGTTRWVF